MKRCRTSSPTSETRTSSRKWAGTKGSENQQVPRLMGRNVLDSHDSLPCQKDKFRPEAQAGLMTGTGFRRDRISRYPNGIQPLRRIFS
jgi:hypothetical protein